MLARLASETVKETSTPQPHPGFAISIQCARPVPAVEEAMIREAHRCPAVAMATGNRDKIQGARPQDWGWGPYFQKVRKSRLAAPTSPDADQHEKRYFGVQAGEPDANIAAARSRWSGGGDSGEARLGRGVGGGFRVSSLLARVRSKEGTESGSDQAAPIRAAVSRTGPSGGEQFLAKQSLPEIAYEHKPCGRTADGGPGLD